MQKRFLVWDEQQNEYRILGYVLSLTPLEGQIVQILLKRDFASMEEIREASARPMSRQGIPVHVHNINQKAFDITGRRLIVFDDGYYHIVMGM